MIKNVIFDVDDTLFPTNEFAELARKKAIRAMIRMGLVNVKEKTLYDKLLKIIKKKGSNYTKHFDDLCSSLRVKNKSKYIAAAIAAYHDTKMSIQPYSVIPSMLLKLHDEGYKLYAATNGRSVKQWDKLIRLGIALYFDGVFVSEDLREEKSPAFYYKVLKHLKTKPSECIMIGDREEYDIVPAKRVGIKTIRVRKGKYSKGSSVADFEVRELGGILRILQKLKTHASKH